MRSRLLFSFSLIAIALTGCETVGSLPASEVREGVILREFVRVGVGNQTIPLPPGDWEVAGVYTERNNVGTPILDAILIQRQGDQLAKVVRLRTPTAIGRGLYGYVISNECGRADVHYMKADSVGVATQDCRLVNHWRMSQSGNIPRAWRAFEIYSDKSGIRRPLAMIGSVYRLGDNRTFLDASYMLNPEVDGFAPPKQSDWSSSDWHRSNVPQDPKKVAYVNRLIAWTDEWHGTVKAGFEGRLPAKSQPPIQAQPQAPRSSSAPAEERLKALDELLRQKLITPEDATRKRKEILESL